MVNKQIDFFAEIREKGPQYVYVRNKGCEERKKDIDDFFELDVIKKYYLKPLKKENDRILSLENIFNLIDDNFIIVIETVYIDKLYRDTYYHFYSEKLNNIGRDCLRISFFKVNDKFPAFDGNKIGFFYDDQYHQILQESIIGTVVIRPLNHYPIGRIILDPFKLSIEKCYLNLSKTEVTILGQVYKLSYFPFSGQDKEFITCAETSLWTIFEFGSHSPEFRSVLPSEFIETLNNINVERTLPSRGLSYTHKAKLLKQFGFYPIVYTREVF